MNLEFYVGGYAQGKLNYVLSKYPKKKAQIVDGDQMLFYATDRSCRCNISGSFLIWNHFHLFVKTMVEARLMPAIEGKDREEIVKEEEQFLKDCWQLIDELNQSTGKLIILSDTLGNGLVPMEEKDRRYRELLGRLENRIGAEAIHVERVIAGIGQLLKKEETDASDSH